MCNSFLNLRGSLHGDGRSYVNAMEKLVATTVQSFERATLLAMVPRQLSAEETSTKRGFSLHLCVAQIGEGETKSSEERSICICCSRFDCVCVLCAHLAAYV